VKPGQKSRGRGIEVFKDYSEILNYIRNEVGAKWVIQKYIENPMIINKKKFDIRQWIVVTDWNPLTVWAYSKSYVRFAAMEYDPKSTNKFAHLTNNCIVKKYKEREDSSGSEDDQEGDLDNIWSSDEFGNHL
jgi:tubulin monoglycylase TTLL3/8